MYQQNEKNTTHSPQNMEHKQKGVNNPDPLEI
jgi:hypothetical protein